MERTGVIDFIREQQKISEASYRNILFDVASAVEKLPPFNDAELTNIIPLTNRHSISQVFGKRNDAFLPKEELENKFYTNRKSHECITRIDGKNLKETVWKKIRSNPCPPFW